jgi:cellulose biosynthesis protein BcsQ
LDNDETDIGGKIEADDTLADDVGRLYSWANVQDAPYRDFSRQRRLRRQPVIQPEATPPAASPDSTSAISGSQPGSPEGPVAAAHEAIPDRLIPVAGTNPGNDALFLHPRAWARPAIAPPDPADSPAPRAAFSEPAPRPAMESNDFRPVVAFYSLAGGVGKTTLCASLGRALYSTGDRVLLVDASGSGLLPFYFGKNDLRPGVHTFFAPGINRPPLRVIVADEITSEWLNGPVQAEMDASYWTIFDLGPASTSLLPQILAMCSILLVPLLPDLNSILTVSRIESSLGAMRSRGAEIPSPFYLFNQFDPEDPVDQGARDLIVRQCGGRLLPLSIPHDAEAARAIASRKTIIDHAPGAQIATVCGQLAQLCQRTASISRARQHFNRRWNDV